jgi:hypothetical protein
VDEHHATYMKELRALYNRHKTKYSPKNVLELW